VAVLTELLRPSPPTIAHAPAYRAAGRSTWTRAAGVDGGAVGGRRGPVGLATMDREPRQHHKPHTPITTSINAPRVRAFGSFAAPSPSFPTGILPGRRLTDVQLGLSHHPACAIRARSRRLS
jgi:hypothetical protein